MTGAERITKLVWAAAGFTAAALAAEYLLPIQGLPYLAAALALCALFGLLLRGRQRRVFLTLLLAAAAGLLLWWGRYALLVGPCEALRGQDLTVTAVVTDYPDEQEDYTGLAIRVTEGAPRVRGYLYAYTRPETEIEPGDVITVPVRMLSAMDTAAGPRRHTHTALGRSLLARVTGQISVTGRVPGAVWRYLPQRLAERIKDLSESLFPPDTAPFAKALMTGDKGDLYETASLYGDMRAAGVLHIVAVSGMHIVILVGMLQLLLGRSRRSSLVCIPVMLLFVLMTGGRASAVRAAAMQSVLLLAPVLEREYDGPASLSAALVLLLGINPMAVGGISFQLSFACVLGFVTLAPGLQAWCGAHLPMERRLVRLLAASVCSTVCAVAFSLPLAALYFGVIPLLSWLANLLTLPVVELCFAGSYLSCAIGAVIPAAGAVLGWAVSWLFRWCALVYRLIAAVPFGCLYTESAGAWIWLAGSYALFLLWYVLGRRGRQIRLLIPAELCLIGACAVMLAGGLRMPAGGEADVLDVGQGQCVALLSDRAVVLVDCGGSGRRNAGDRAADYLLSRGLDHVDALILTHLHEDHTNGVSELLARIPAARVILPADYDDEDHMLEPVAAAAEACGAELLFLDRETDADVGRMHLTLLLPRAGSQENDRGIVVLAELPALDVLVMGDAGAASELALLQRGIIPDVDLLVAGHHGAAGSTGTLLLGAASPETAAISAGAGNPYGHPAEETLERLTDCGVRVLRTDTDGTLIIHGKEGGPTDG